MSISNLAAKSEEAQEINHGDKLLVNFGIAFSDVCPQGFADLPAGFICKGIFYPAGSVARHFAEKQFSIKKSKEVPHVYFVQSEKGGPVKIGSALNVENRLSALQTAHPYLLKVIHVIPHAGIEAEKSLHARFSKHRLNGEWFEWNEDLERLVEGKDHD